MGLSQSKKFNPANLPDLTGKVIVITGGAAGLGFAITQHLVRKGAKIYIAARAIDRAEDAIKRLKAAGLGPGNGQLESLELDLIDPHTVKRAAEEFMRRESRLDVLSELRCVSKRAFMMCPYQKTNHGIQDVVMINHIGHFVFIKTLLPILKNTASEPNSDVRIVVVSSDGYEAVRHPVKFETIEDFNLEYKDAVFPWPSLQRYCYSKLLVCMQVAELQRRLDAEGVPSLFMVATPVTDPAPTDGAQNWLATLGTGFLATLATWIVSLFFTLPTIAAYGTVFASAAPEVRAEPRKYRSAYITPPTKNTGLNEKARDPVAARELWELTERTLKDIGV
ncbi:NAD-P-binding protein [Fomitopsis serialis]|uniref:NAD-P-binding protein n=1 Tax=Fomitopsis serialis TaxID=139415 RepID=UPI002008B716|nr:NAD-P-binding protein [Neoantrodia serialis]KAH9916819.1 NAD-P-binding protein [Neoantrodia serialis]